MSAPVPLSKPLKIVKLEVRQRLQEPLKTPTDFVDNQKLKDHTLFQYPSSRCIEINDLFPLAHASAKNDARIICDNEDAQQSYIEQYGNVVGVDGEAGAGKTTLCKAFAQLSMQDGKSPVILFFIQVKKVNFEIKTKFFRFLLTTCLPHWKHDPEADDKITEALVNNPDVVFIIDGLDESSADIWSRPTYNVNVYDEATADVFLKNLLNGSILPKAKKLVTSRTHQMLSLLQEYRPKTLFEVLGLTIESQTDLGKQICGERFSEIQSFFKANPSIASALNVPVFFILTVAFLLKNPSSHVPNITNIFVSTCGSFSRSAQMRNKKCDILGLARLAWNGFIHGKYDFDKNDVDEAGVSREAIESFLKISMVDAEGVHLTILEGDKLAFFSHLIWQEFFVACHIMLSLPFDNFAAVLNQLHEVRWQTASKFVVGLSDVNLFRELNSLTGLSSNMASWKRKKEAVSHFLNNTIPSTFSLRLLSRQNFTRKLLQACTWLQEANDEAITKDAAMQLPPAIALSGQMSTAEAASLCHVMQAGDGSIITLGFDKDIPPRSIITVLQKSQNIDVMVSFICELKLKLRLQQFWVKVARRKICRFSEKW